MTFTISSARTRSRTRSRRSGAANRLVAALGVLLMTLWFAPAAPAATEQQLQRARAERAAIQQELDGVVAAYDQAQAKLARTESSIATNQRLLEDAEARQETARSRLSERAGTMYKQGPVTLFHFLLGSESIADFGRRMVLLEGAAKQDALVLDEAARTRSEYLQLLEVLESEEQEQQALISAMTGQTQSIGDSFARAQALESQLAQDRSAAVQAAERERAARAAEEARQREEGEARAAAARRAAEAEAAEAAEAERLQQQEAARQATPSPSPSPSPTPAAQASPSPPSGGSGGMACPVDGPHSFTDTFGAPRSGGRSHQGVDMFAPMRTPVAAIVDGTVLRRNSSPLGGLALYLRGSNGNEYFYAHLAGYTDVAVGAAVKAGDHLGFVGDTGNARGGPPHLHFEVRTSSGIVNPTPVVRRACG